MLQSELVHDELVQEFYGLDLETMLVDSISIAMSGKMHRWTEANGYLTAQLSGPSMQAEGDSAFWSDLPGSCAAGCIGETKTTNNERAEGHGASFN